MNSKVTGEGAAADYGDDVKKKHCNFCLKTTTFELRHEDKTCSACPEEHF